MNELIQQCVTEKVGLMDREESLSEKLERRKARARAELDKIQAAIDALNENPKVAQVIDLVIKACR